MFAGGRGSVFCVMHACGDGVFKVCGLQRGQGRDLICDWWIGISKWACKEVFGFGGGWGLGRGMGEGGQRGREVVGC